MRHDLTLLAAGALRAAVWAALCALAIIVRPRLPGRTRTLATVLAAGTALFTINGVLRALGDAHYRLPDGLRTAAAYSSTISAAMVAAAVAMLLITLVEWITGEGFKPWRR